MSKKQPEKNQLTLKTKDDNDGKQRSYHFDPEIWFDICSVAMQCVELGGSVGAYSSRDGNAFCLSIRSGDDKRQYWFGPDVNPSTKLAQIERDWGLRPEFAPLSEFLRGVVLRYGGRIDD